MIQGILFRCSMTSHRPRRLICLLVRSQFKELWYHDCLPPHGESPASRSIVAEQVQSEEVKRYQGIEPNVRRKSCFYRSSEVEGLGGGKLEARS